MSASWTIVRLCLLGALALGGVACRERDGPSSGSSARPCVGGECACINKVLVIVDGVPEGAEALAVALTAAGFEVTTSAATSSEYAGRPSLAGEPAPFGAVVVLAGDLPRTPPPDMPAAGQKAIVDFVHSGHGLVLTEWAAFHVAADPTPGWQILKPLVLLSRTGGYIGQLTYEVEPTFASHPIWAGLPPSFTFSSASNVGTIDPASGATRVAHSTQAMDAVALRDFEPGRVVHLAHAGNHVSHGWSNVNIQRLVTNAVGWAAHCP
jgi:hypothetical protein